MAATDLTQLFDFEGAFEDAAQVILATNGITAFISQQADKIPLIAAEIGCDIGPAIDELNQIPAPTNWPANQAPPQEYFRYVAALEFVVEVPRDQEGQVIDPSSVATLLREVRGRIRAAMMRVVYPFNGTNLPLYKVTDIRPNGTTTGFEAKRNIDFCSLRFLATFEIRPDAWPAWVES